MPGESLDISRFSCAHLPYMVVLNDRQCIHTHRQKQAQGGSNKLLLSTCQRTAASELPWKYKGPSSLYFPKGDLLKIIQLNILQ